MLIRIGCVYIVVPATGTDMAPARTLGRMNVQREKPQTKSDFQELIRVGCVYIRRKTRQVLVQPPDRTVLAASRTWWWWPMSSPNWPRHLWPHWCATLAGAIAINADGVAFTRHVLSATDILLRCCFAYTLQIQCGLGGWTKNRCGLKQIDIVGVFLLVQCDVRGCDVVDSNEVMSVECLLVHAPYSMWR